MNIADITRGGFDESRTYDAYDLKNVFKCTSDNLKNTVEYIKSCNINERILIELPSTIGVTHEIIESLPNNVDVRVTGGLTSEYASAFRTRNMDGLREKSTYSKQELDSIVSRIEEIESHIDPSWNAYEKALYLYEYMKSYMVYRKPEMKGLDGLSLDKASNVDRTRTWDSLTGLINQLSTCNGYAHMYQELCRRQGIECAQVSGRYGANGEGAHAWNVVTINDKSFIVDIIWDSKEYEKGIDQTTGFANVDKNLYKPKSYKEKHLNLYSINSEWLEATVNKVSQNVPKELLAEEKIANFLRIRELDRQRMIELREKMINEINQQVVVEDSLGGISK